jgi:aryl-alcohol dehydrogenase-like predicted oxidoreductase
MKTRILGSTGLEVSVVGIGTWQFGGEWGRTYEQSEADSIFNAARDCGINLIDTAECYGDHTSERFIGHSIQHDRDQWIVATKFGHKFKKNFERDNIIDPAGVLQQLEDSLRALRTDYIDLYQFHSLDDDAFRTEALWETLDKEVQKGKIRHLGISIGSNENLWQTQQAGAVKAETIQVVYNRLNRAPEKEVFAECQKQNLGVLARVPLASGYLSGKYRPGAKFPANDMRAQWHSAENREAQLAEVEKIRADELPEGGDMAAWALAWCLRNPAVTIVIPGCKDAHQVKANAAAVELL